MGDQTPNKTFLVQQYLFLLSYLLLSAIGASRDPKVMPKS